MRGATQTAHSAEMRFGSRPAAAGIIRCPTNDAPEHVRPTMLRDFFGRLGINYHVQPEGDAPVEIDLTIRALPGLQIMSGRMQGARYLRTRESSDPTEDVGLIVNPNDAMLVRQAGREIMLSQGDAILVSLDDPLETTQAPPGNMIGIRLPSLPLVPRLSHARDRFLRPVPYCTPALRLLHDYIAITRSMEDKPDGELKQAIVAHFYDLIAVAVGATRDAAELAQGRGLRAARLQAIKRDIARDLAAPDLNVATLSVRHGCTPRFIQRLFEYEGTSFTDYVLAQRLERAYGLLVDPRRAGEKVSTIALDAGFGDVSYFNRAFRRRYGDTPSGVRGLRRMMADDAARREGGTRDILAAIAGRAVVAE